MLYTETIAVCSDIHTKHRNTMCGQNLELLTAKSDGSNWAVGIILCVCVYEYTRMYLCPFDCIMTNVMHKFLIYLSIYFRLTCFGLSFNPSSEAGVQFGSGSGLLGMVSAPERWHHTQQTVHYVGHYTTSSQIARSLQHKMYVHLFTCLFVYSSIL
jgi:hypothetical protein